MILSTKFHSKDQIEYLNSNKEIGFFLDLDLSILGTEDYNDYLNYVQNIRMEFSLYNNEEFKKGRTDFLKRMLNRNFLFYTGEMKQRFEANAYNNLKKELNSYI